MMTAFSLLLAIHCARTAADNSRLVAAPQLAARIDALAEQCWREKGVRPVGLADDSTFLRRVTLDLVGRIPTYREAVTFAADRSASKRAQAIRRLLSCPEHALHLGRVLDDLIQEHYAGDPAFVEYLRAAVAAHKPWDRVFREVLLGPWDSPDRRGADRFLRKRVRSLDDLTNDTARVFFGVNVSCAKCHDHPLVSDWSQDRYYGMAAFFNPTYEAAKDRGSPSLGEKATSDVTFTTTAGVRRSARMTFLTGRVVSDALILATSQAPVRSSLTVQRRAQLVQVALEEKTFFSRAIVNRLWASLLGRGLVHPVDQMHSANPPSVPGLLEWLAEDFAAHGYDLDCLVAGIVSSHVYQRASSRTGLVDEADEKVFARSRMRPLTPEQYAISLALATGNEAFDRTRTGLERVRQYRELEARVASLARSGALDAPADQFQSSPGEALFMSNAAEVQRLAQPAGHNLAARLAAVPDSRQLVDIAFWSVLSRPPAPEEHDHLMHWLDQHKQDRRGACAELVWALMASAEFRFNH
jgi:hypothetical protein